MKGKINLGQLLKKHSPTVLTCIGAVGVVVTAVISVKATPKAMTLIQADSRKNHEGDSEAYTKTEAIKSCWFCYIPSLIIGAATIACIFSANVLNKKQQAAITSAYALLSSSYKEYKSKLKELYGEEAHQKIVDSIVKENCDRVDICVPGIFTGDSCLLVDEPSESTMLFYDLFSERYFESTIARVMNAEYHLNRNFTMRGSSPLNEFYEFLGLDILDSGDILGWDMTDGLLWIDFNHRTTVLEDGLECCIIEMIFEPNPPGDDCSVDITD